MNTLLLGLTTVWVVLAAMLVAYGVGRHHGLEDALADGRGQPPTRTDGAGRDPMYHLRRAIAAADDEGEVELLEDTHNQIVALRAARSKRKEKKP